MKKTYEVELRRTSFITVTVEAENEDDAEALAWQESVSFHNSHDASWDIESIEEVETKESEMKTWRESIEEINQGESK
jgi:hypothetical protein